MRLPIALVLLLSCGLLAAAGIVHLGLPDVAATTPHWRITKWVLSTTMENAVRRRADGIDPPGDLDDPSRVRSGAASYDAMCAGCHAAPDAKASVIAEGLLPAPPALADEVDEWSAAELFWITRHGVRMTGMPAFGPTHSDREIWDLVAFLRRLSRISPSAYRSLVDGAGDGHHHDHGASSRAPARTPTRAQRGGWGRG